MVREETRSMHNLAPRFLLGLSLGVLTLVGAAGCHRDPNAVDTASAPDSSGPDPADANMAPVDNSQPPPAAPPPPDQDQAYQDAQTADQLDEEGQTPPVEYADEPPPPLPVYEQPEAPE